MAKYSVTFDFDDKDDRDEFIGWMSDGGGEQNFDMPEVVDTYHNFKYVGSNDDQDYKVEVTKQP
jgi:hypothetical protein